MYQTYGSKWALIAKFLPGRTENSIKNRFYSTIRKMNNQKKETERYSLSETKDLTEIQWTGYPYQEGTNNAIFNPENFYLFLYRILFK